MGIRHQSFLLIVLFLLFIMETKFVDALSDREMCEQCQKVLYRTFLYYRVQTTKRLLRHKLKHLCKRYFEYRRHCLITMLPRVDLIWADMEKVLNGDGAAPAEFKPYGTCAAIKECDKEHQPLTTFGPDDGGGAGGAIAEVVVRAANPTTTTSDTISSSSSSDATDTTTTTNSSWSTTTTTTATTTTAHTTTVVESDNEESMLMLDFF